MDTDTGPTQRRSHLSVNYVGLIPVLIEALKELNEKCVPCDLDIIGLIRELQIANRELADADLMHSGEDCSINRCLYGYRTYSVHINLSIII